MPTFLVGILYHEPAFYRLWLDGAIEDYESSTGLFVEASGAAEAIAWGEIVGAGLLRHLNQDPALDWKALAYRCWIVDDPLSSDWSHCLEFFQRVQAGEFPSLEAMTTASYERWFEKSKPPERPQSLMERIRDAASKIRRDRMSGE